MNNRILGIAEMSKESTAFEQSPYPYYQDLGKALLGLELALERHSGNIGEVKNTDILAFSNIDPDVLQNVFTDANGLIKLVYKEIGALFIRLENLPTENSDELLLTMFKELGKRAVMMKIIFLLNDYSIWKRSLRKLVTKLAKGWPLAETQEWENLYEIFCCQLQSILQKWSESSFSTEHISKCIQLTYIWLQADENVGIAAGNLLGRWE